MGEHSRFSPSGSSRWLACPGSIALCEKVPEPPESPFAKEGTSAHHLASLVLTSKSRWDADVVSKLIGKKLIDDKLNKYTVSDDMAEAVQLYVDTINLIADDKVNIEKKFNLNELVPGLFGTCDCSIVDAEAKVLYVVDYKHGKGVEVEAEHNTQMMIYALGALKDAVSKIGSIETIEMLIVQPRINKDEKVKRFTMSFKDLQNWVVMVLIPSAKRTYEENAPLCAGKHCRFCKALAVCPAQAEHVLALAKTDFKDPVFPDPNMLTPMELAKILEVSSVVNAWVSQVQAYSQQQAELGIEIPGHKLVAKKSNRKWIDEEEAIKEITAYLGQDAFEKKLLSVAKAEKILKQRKLPVDTCLKGLWEKPDAGLTLVSDMDRRTGVVPDEKYEFLSIAEFLQ